MSADNAWLVSPIGEVPGGARKNHTGISKGWPEAREFHKDVIRADHKAGKINKPLAISRGFGRSVAPGMADRGGPLP